MLAASFVCHILLSEVLSPHRRSRLWALNLFLIVAGKSYADVAVYTHLYDQQSREDGQIQRTPLPHNKHRERADYAGDKKGQGQSKKTILTLFQG